MADRVHPDDSAVEPLAGRPEPEGLAPFENTSERSKPPPGTYVIQVPKDQIYRVPSPGNARRYEDYSRRALHRRRRTCRTCLCWTAGVILLLVLAAASTAGILYLVFRPELPRYSVDRLAASGLNVTSGSPLSPGFVATLRAENPNKKISIDYRNGSSVALSYSGVNFCNGVWPAFHQGTRNVTVLQTALSGSGIRLSAAMQKSLAGDQVRGAVPLALDANVPVRVKLGALTSWTITVKVRCDITVDKLTADSRIVSNNCKVKVDVF